MYLLYDAILLLAALFLVPYYLVRATTRGKVRRGLRERLGLIGRDRLVALQGREVIWIHAVSVGETRAAIPLIRALRQRYPEKALLLTNVTETGHGIAQGITELDLCLFFPFDLSFVMRRVLRKIEPRLIVIVETEIWPNFVRLARGRGIPVILVNGRISDRSFPRYMKGRLLLKPILRRFSAFGMQTDLDAERIIAMGADCANVSVTRNLKFDLKATPPGGEELERLRKSFRIAADTLVWVAGSTHAGEEEIVAETYRRLVEEGRNLVLVLVPRHPERCRSVAEMLAAMGMGATLRSAIESHPEPLRPREVLLVDSVGEMLKFYAFSDVVFVGGSLQNIGGHNILEACLLRKAVLFGPHMHNFKEISRIVQEAGGGLQVEDGDELQRVLGRLLDRPDERRRLGERGFELVSRNAGATDQTLRIIEQALD